MMKCVPLLGAPVFQKAASKSRPLRFALLRRLVGGISSSRHLSDSALRLILVLRLQALVTLLSAFSTGFRLNCM